MAGIYPPFPLSDESPQKCEETEQLKFEENKHRALLLGNMPSEDLEHKADHSPLAIHYLSIERFLKIMFCYFTEKRGALFVMSVLVNGIVWTASCYQLIYALICIMKSRSITSTTSAIALTIIWVLQSLISHLFLIRWQLSGELREIIIHLTVAHDPSIHTVPQRALRQTVLVFYVAIILIALVNIGCVLTSVFGIRVEIINSSERKMYYFEALHSLRFVFSFYTFVTFGLSVAIFALFTRATTTNFDYLNANIAKIGLRRSTVVNDLIHAMRTYMKLLGAVRELNKAFEVYAFLMLGTIVPITIFSIFMFAFTMHMSWMNVIVTIPSLALSVAELIIFTLIPAKLHTSLASSKQIVLANEYLWIPFSEEVYHSVSAFLAHASQTDMGLTIWGFAVVTKPMILTTISMMVTCFAFLLEMRRDDQ